MQSQYGSRCVRNCDGLPPKSNFDQAPTETRSGIRRNGPPNMTLPADMSAIDSTPHPVPYTFRVPVPTPQACRRSACPQNARAPPFCLQLDHTLAVLWCLFRKKANKDVGEECELGVGQLQWALYFLKGIKPPNGGDRAEDVTIAIQAVQDALLDLYADMSDVVMQPPQPGAPFTPGSVPVYGGSTLTPLEHVPSLDLKSPCTTCQAERNKPIIPTWVPPVPTSSCSKTCTGMKSDASKGEGKPRKSGPKKEEAATKPSSKPRQNSKKAGSGKGGSKAGSKKGSKTHVTNKDSKQSAQDPQLIQEIKDLRTAAMELSKRMPRSESEGSRCELNMLHEWRKEQVNRVQDELRRLRSLDSALGIQSDMTEVNMPNTSSSFNPIAASTQRPTVSR